MAKTNNMMRKLEMILDGSLPPLPIASLIGFTHVSIEPGREAIEFKAGRRHANPKGIAYASKLKEGESFTTLEFKINFVKLVWQAKLCAQGQVVNSGKTVGLVMCNVFDEKDRLVAHASSTCMTLRGEQATGR